MHNVLSVMDFKMNIELRWLEDFSVLATTCSFSKAAEQRFVTQPAFSRRIKNLEDVLGFTLINRSRTPIEVTEAGQVFLITARNIIEQLHEVVRHIHHIETTQGEILRFAAAHSLAQGFFPQWMARLRREGLSVACQLVASNVGEATRAIREGACDLMLAYHDPESALQLPTELFPWLVLGQTEMVPVCGLDDNKRPLFTISNQHQFPLLAYGQGAFLGHSVNLLLRQSKLRYVKLFETAVADSLKAMAIEGLGVAWLPKLSVSNELARNELVICGDEQWFIPLEIRLYRCSLIKKTVIKSFWDQLTTSQNLMNNE